MTSASKIRLVAGREIAERLRGRAIWVMSALSATLVVLGIVLPGLVRSPSAPTVVELVGPAARALGQGIESEARLAHLEVRVVDASSALARRRVRSGAAALALAVAGGRASALVESSLAPEVAAVIETVLGRAHASSVLARAGVSRAVASAIEAPVPLDTVRLRPPKVVESGRKIAAIAAAILLWISIGVYGGVVATGVAQEKTSRTAEVLLATLESDELLIGKVVGIGACGLGQTTVAVVAGLVANAAVSGAHLPSTLWVLFPMVLVWFLLGYALYALAFAAAGAVVSRQEEVQLVTSPIATLLVGGYLLTYAAIASPGAQWLKVLSFVPPLAPILMPARIALGHVAAWEIALSAVITLVSIVSLERLAASIYASSLLRSGARQSWREVLGRPRTAA